MLRDVEVNHVARRGTAPGVLACVLATVISVAPAMGDGSASELRREKIWKFEQSIRPLPAETRSVKVRDFFAALEDTESRIEAIGMMDSRYVYVVPKDVRSELLGKLLMDRDLRVRTRAANAIAYNGLGSTHAEGLRTLLREPAADAKGAALMAMGRAHDLRFLPEIRPYLSDPSATLRLMAGVSLWRLQPSAPELEAMLNDPEPSVRSGVVQHIPRSEGALRLLRDASPDVRERAACAAAASGDPSRAEKVAPLLKDPSERVRATAAYAVGRLKGLAYREEIETLFKRDSDLGVRRYCVLALAELRSPDSLPVLRAALRDPDDQIPTYAMRAIRLIEDPTLDPDSLR